MSTRRRRVRSIVVRVAVFLLLGAMVNVATCIAIMLSIDPRLPNARQRSGTSPDGFFRKQDSEYWGWIAYRDDTPLATRIISRWYGKDAGGGGSGGIPDEPAGPLLPMWAPQLDPANREVMYLRHYVIAWEYGWPARALGGLADCAEADYMRVRLRFALTADPDLFNDPNDHWDVRLLGYRPLWPGFAANALLFGGAMWLLFAAPMMLRRWWRTRRLNRGLCPACAYPIGASEVCTECGAAFRRVG